MPDIENIIQQAYNITNKQATYTDMYAEAVQLVCSEAPHLYHRVWRERRELSSAPRSGSPITSPPCALRVGVVATLYGTCEIRRAEVIVLADGAHHEKTPISDVMRRRLLDLNDLSASLAADVGSNGKLFVCWISLTDAEERCVMGQDVYIIDAAKAESGPLWEGDVHPPRSPSPLSAQRNGFYLGESTEVPSPVPLNGVMHIEVPDVLDGRSAVSNGALVHREKTSPAGLTDRSPSFGSRATTETTSRREGRRVSGGHSSRGSGQTRPVPVTMARQDTSPLDQHSELLDPRAGSDSDRGGGVGAGPGNGSFVSSAGAQSARMTPNPLATAASSGRDRAVGLYQRNKQRRSAHTPPAPYTESPQYELPRSSSQIEEWVRAGGSVDVQALALSTSRAASAASNQLIEAQGQLSQLSKLCSILDVERQEGAALQGLLSRVAASVHLVEERIADVERLVRRQSSMKDAGTECDFTRVSRATASCQTDTVVFADDYDERPRRESSSRRREALAPPLITIAPPPPGTPQGSSPNQSPLNGALGNAAHPQHHQNSSVASTAPSPSSRHQYQKPAGQYGGPASGASRSPLHFGPITIPRAIPVGRATSSHHLPHGADDVVLTPRGVRPVQQQHQSIAPNRRTSFDKSQPPLHRLVEELGVVMPTSTEQWIPTAAATQRSQPSHHQDHPEHRHHVPHGADLSSIGLPVREKISAWVHDVTGHMRDSPPDEWGGSWRDAAGPNGAKRGGGYPLDDEDGGIAHRSISQQDHVASRTAPHAHQQRPLPSPAHQLGHTSHFWGDTGPSPTVGGGAGGYAVATSMSMGVFTAAWGGDRRHNHQQQQSPRGDGSSGRGGLRDVPTGNMFRKRGL